MPGRSLSPMVFRRRSHVPAEATLSFDDVLFPKVYEDAWGSAGGDLSDFARAQNFLLRMSSTFDPQTRERLVYVVKQSASASRPRTIQVLALDIRDNFFSQGHASFATNPLLQIGRFMLLKARIPELIYSDTTREVVDFFFDPTLERNLSPLPSGEVVYYKYPTGRLKVAIVGGGPTALASAISLAEKGAGKVEVHMYERRWVRKQAPNGTTYIDYPATAKRRDQVVTLQDTVTSLLSKPSYHALFAGRPERVWPGSANIQIRKVEDRFLKRVQDPEFRGVIHLHPEGVTREDLEKVGDFHVLLGADGAASWVRKSYFNGYENERGRSYALGLAFDRPAGLPWSQPLNMFLTLGQTRYLLNASDFDGRGYLNMQLTEDEWEKMTSVDGQFVHFGRPGCLRRPDGSVPEGFEESQVFAPSEDRHSPLWTSISDGLKLFGFKESEVINVVRIPIVVQAVREGVHVLPRQEARQIKRPHALVAVAGDAAMTVHFWPGRGLNSGIKAGLALGDELVYALNTGRFVGMPLDAMKQYNDFILKLQAREHDKRSIPILNQSGTPETLGWLLDKAQSVPDQVAVEWLLGAMTQIADRLEQRDDWAFAPIANVEPQLQIVLRQLSSTTLKEMAVSFPWPTREMAGAEVLPIRSLKAEEKQKWIEQLWDKLREERRKEGRSPSRHDPGRSPRASSSSRFEAPRLSSPLPTSPDPRRGVMKSGHELVVPGDERSRARSPSPSRDGEVSLGRMLTVYKKPPSNVLGDALSLALFRVQEAS